MANVTIREVAERAQVSVMTVSRVLNDSPHVSSEMRRRVNVAIAELGYVPNQLARGLSRNKTGVIGVIVPDVANPFFTMVLRGAEEVAAEAQYHVMFCDTRGNLALERKYLENMVGFRAEGLLIAPVGDRSRAHLRLLARSGVPFVLIDRWAPDIVADLVQSDSVAGAKTLTKHLLGLRHRRIAMVTESPEISTARERLQGYREALAEAGIDFDPTLVKESSAIDLDLARAATLELLEHRDPPTAVFAVNNIAAVGVAEAAGERELKIPKDLSLVCFDDIERQVRLRPFLTVMAQPAKDFGMTAAHLLLDRLAGRRTGRGQRYLLEATFIPRASSSEAPSARRGTAQRQR